jgi:hypothetical protein
MRPMPPSSPALSLVLLLAACGGDQKVGVFNTAPSASITSPPDGSAFDEGAVVTFEALVSDDFDPLSALNIGWSSDRDGALESAGSGADNGIVTFSTANLSAGNHAITLLVVDSEGEGGSATIALTIHDLPDAPTISIVHPAGGESGEEDEEFEFVVQVADSFDEAPTLTLSFQSDLDGEFCTPTADAVGVATCEAALSPGDHLLTFTVTDTEGFSASATYYFAVLALTAIDNDGDGFTEEQGDCNDADGSVGPTATEYYNGRDDDCDGVVDNDTEGYDDDGDGYTEASGDCDDTDANTYPTAAETCDGEDDDCDGTIDETTTCYDDDLDGYTEIGGDCDDSSYVSYPGATEIEDGKDNDCDGVVDEGTNAYDDDGDGYTENAGDCDDTNSAISPAATEKCGDAKDNDCDGTADEENASGCTTYYYDYDGDAYGSASVSGKCLCATSGYYTSAYNTDCYDYNSKANPAATTYQSSHRGDSSYDFNCDGSQTKYYSSTASCNTALGDCEVSASGWESSVPSCGSSGNWSTTSDDDGCSWSWSSFACKVTPTTTNTQTCL